MVLPSAAHAVAFCTVIHRSPAIGITTALVMMAIIIFALLKAACNRWPPVHPQMIQQGGLAIHIEAHAALEKQHKQRGSAFFQLCGKLQRAHVAHPVDSDAAEPTVEEVEEMELDSNANSACPSKPEAGNHKIRALFGRRRTHNEQIMVHPCGIIVARQTFFGSETTPQTVVSAQFYLVLMLATDKLHRT